MRRRLTDDYIRRYRLPADKRQVEILDSGEMHAGVTLALVVGKRRRTWYANLTKSKKRLRLGFWRMGATSDEWGGNYALGVDSARRAVRQIADEIADGEPVRLILTKHRTPEPDDGRTFEALRVRYIEYCRSPASDDSPRPVLQSWPEYDRILRNDFATLDGRQIHDITVDHIHAILMAKVEAGKPRAADMCRAVMMSFFKWCLALRLVESNPAAEIPPLGKTLTGHKAKSWRPLSWDELVSVWHACERDGSAAARWYQLLILSGSRPEAVKAALWSEVVPSRETPSWLVIPADRWVAVGGKKVSLRSQKSGDAHPIFFGTPIARHVLAVLEGMSQTFLIPSSKTKEMHLQDPRRSLARIRKASGVKDLVPRMIRPTFTTRARDAGLSGADISLILDHVVEGTARITAAHYMGVSDADLRSIEAGLTAWQNEVDRRLQGEQAPSADVIDIRRRLA